MELEAKAPAAANATSTNAAVAYRNSAVPSTLLASDLSLHLQSARLNAGARPSGQRGLGSDDLRLGSAASARFARQVERLANRWVMVV